MQKADLKQFDYKEVGKIDAEMWRSYYNRQFLKLFWQLLKLTKNQLGLNWWITLRIAFYAGWAAADYRINRKNVNQDRVRNNLIKFYKVVSGHVIEPFDHVKAGEFELAWWDIHRSSYKNNPKLERSLAEAAAAMYNISPNKLKEYAHYRAIAMILPRHVGDKKNETDWHEVRALLVKSWRSLHSVVNG
jgi:hypothetical protein